MDLFFIRHDAKSPKPSTHKIDPNGSIFHFMILISMEVLHAIILSPDRRKALNRVTSSRRVDEGGGDIKSNSNIWQTKRNSLGKIRFRPEISKRNETSAGPICAKTK
ncbi:hypothetical protein AVEN_11316-1 [Araneus ventricosus]|uniref:Uncharacterized protein n=1 Tax=Araneus ventricosus TaxID=182803 RepID=A0A4Y2DZU0_ARAVE|nr:hypothetical protein AVEN_11316-1 [Araneus ventricosus]